MGNEQSVPAPRRPQNRLSKPRTNNNSSANLLNTKSAPPSRRNSIISISASPTKSRYSIVPVLVPEEKKKEEKKEEKRKKRRSLFRSKSAQPKSQYRDAESEVEDVSADPSAIGSRRWSRQPRGREPAALESGDEAAEAPLEMRPPPLRKRMSLSQPYGHTNPRLSLVAELPSRPEQADSIQRFSGFEEDEPIHKCMSRTPSEAEIYVPIRRRSLLQHGVATRRSYVDEPRQSLPPQPRNVEEFQNHYYDPAKPTSSPLSQIAALQPPPEFLPGPRVETPTEMDYGHIGAFKLGSLRIMNGAASPASSLGPSLRRAATMGPEEDYLMAGEARRSVERGHRQGLSQRSNTISVPSESQKLPWLVRAESPLRQDVAEMGEDRPQTPTRVTQLEWSEEEQSPMPPKCVFNPLSIDIPDPSFALFDFNATETLFRSTESPTKALELANEYQQDLAMSPFSFDNSPPVSPTLQVMSKHMAVEDDLFAPEPLTPALSERFPRSFDSGYEGGPPARTVKGPRDLAPKPLAKADSGYSSNVSLRSFKKESTPAHVEEPPPTPPKDTLRVASSTYSEEWSSRVSSSTYSVVSTRSQVTLRAQRSLPALPTEDQTPEQPFRQPPPVPTKQTQRRESLPVAQKPDLTYPSALSPHLVIPPRESRRKSTPPNHRGRQEIPATDVSSTSSRWSSKKLNKRAQAIQPEPVYTVQAFRSPSEQLRIPAPSVEARRKLEERVDQFPMASIPNTYVNQLSLRHSSSKETLGTIFSVGSAEVREELSFARLQSSLPAVPTQPTIPEDPTTNMFHKGEFSARETYHRPREHELPPLPGNRKDLPTSSLVSRSEFNRRNTYQSPLPALPTAQELTRNSMQPTTRERSQSRTRTQAEFETHITSFDGVSSSLGRSPYDAALSAPKSSAASKRERAESMTARFEVDAAERFARQRSISQESSGTVIRSRKSYDSIVNGNPYLEAENKSERHRGRPPQAHAKFTAMKRQSSPSLLSSFSTGRREPSPANSHIGEQFGGWAEEGGEEKRFSTLSSLSKKTRSPPPVSMTTQRKVTPTPLGAHTLIPSSRTPPIAAQAPNRAARQMPAQFVPEQEQAANRGPGWSQPANFWAERRKSAGEALKVQTRKSMELRQPETKPELRSRKSMDAYAYRQQQAAKQAPMPNLRSRKSMDAHTYGESMSGNAQRRTLNSGYRSFDNSQGSGWTGWNVGVGYENHPHNPHAQPSWVDGTIRTTTPYQGHAQSQAQSQEYDHTYGNSSHHNKENIQHEYYDQSQEQSTNLPETIHQRKTSTSEMLVLDRFAGGLDYGYEAGQGLSGSAGMRNTGKMAVGRRKGGPVSERYGLDFSDVPVIVQRVPVRG
ncbi:hypothetical protein BKA65DRAFT_163961 [Rhexocercosporidium sp. MPI-PUGE-AT-0058]|nr:hypothetical protein BKA65DRAFT_163961 [Rhexocercosporidium sp. MPI-PUGE-AT-0058]